MYEWDDKKAEDNAAKHGVTFLYAAEIFSDPCLLVWLDTRSNYGEDRYTALGMIEGRVYVVVYTIRKGTLRLISARKANTREVKEYEKIQT